MSGQPSLAGAKERGWQPPALGTGKLELPGIAASQSLPGGGWLDAGNSCFVTSD